MSWEEKLPFLKTGKKGESSLLPQQEIMGDTVRLLGKVEGYSFIPYNSAEITGSRFPQFPPPGRILFPLLADPDTGAILPSGSLRPDQIRVEFRDEKKAREYDPPLFPFPPQSLIVYYQLFEGQDYQELILRIPLHDMPPIPTLTQILSPIAVPALSDPPRRMS